MPIAIPAKNQRCQPPLSARKLNNIAYALIIGGALGNLFDRLWHGFV
ncbi:signal peptidase II, partial [Escherichia coli]